MVAATRLYMCLDQGGHASRAIVLDDHGETHASAHVAVATRRDGMRVEHDPDQLVASLQAAAAEALAQLGTAAVHLLAAGLATQRSSIVCWERGSGKVLSPVISWQDTRAQQWAEQFRPDQAAVHAITGLVVSPYYGFSKLRWCLDNLPEVQAAHAAGSLCFGPLAAFLAQRLTGQATPQVDPANASRTLLWDRHTGDWSAELLRKFAIPRECLPDCVSSQQCWGDLQLADLQLPLKVVTGDQSAALFAFGKPDAGTVYANLGTGAFLQRAAGEAPHTDLQGLLNSVVYQDETRRYAVIEATVNGAGSALHKVADDLGIAQERLQASAGAWLQQHAGSGLFLNAVSGLGSPWWLGDARAEFVSLQDAVLSPEQKIAAVLESIVFLLAVNLRVMNRVLGEPSGLVVTGGLGSVQPLLQTLADCVELPVSRAEDAEATARGLAFLLAGQPVAWPHARIDLRCLPQRDSALQARFAQWCELMPPL